MTTITNGIPHDDERLVSLSQGILDQCEKHSVKGLLGEFRVPSQSCDPKQATTNLWPYSIKRTHQPLKNSLYLFLFGQEKPIHIMANFSQIRNILEIHPY